LVGVRAQKPVTWREVGFFDGGNRQREPLSSSPARKRADLNMSKLRSALTNGSELLVGIDHRLPWMRRLRDCISAACADAGGADNLTQAEKVLIHRSAMLTVLLEQHERRFGEQDGNATSEQLYDYLRALNSLRRVFETLSVGLPRRAKDVTPSVSEYLAASEAAE
jgi:hypothetical protein